MWIWNFFLKELISNSSPLLATEIFSLKSNSLCLIPTYLPCFVCNLQLKKRQVCFGKSMIKTKLMIKDNLTCPPHYPNHFYFIFVFSTSMLSLLIRIIHVIQRAAPSNTESLSFTNLQLCPRQFPYASHTHAHIAIHSLILYLPILFLFDKENKLER